MKAPISTAIAITAGILILLGYFFPSEALVSLRTVMLRWAIILAAFALIIGIINLVRVHLGKVQQGVTQAVYSIVLLASLFITVIIVSLSTPTGALSLWLFNNVQIPIEASLMALLAVLLAAAAVRILRRRLNTFSVIFLVTALLVLIGTVPIIFLGEIPAFRMIREVIVEVPAVAGTRGILLGVALGAIATGVRVLIGADRPYGG